MKTGGCILIALVALCISAQSATLSGRSLPKYAPGRVLVKFRSSASLTRRSQIHALLGTRTLRRFTTVEGLELTALPDNLSVRRAIRAFRQRPEVEYAEPDYIVHAIGTPDDSLFPQMWNLLNTGQNGGTTGADIGATSAWNFSTGSQSVVVAVIDSGIDYTHPDLQANVWSAPSSFSNVENGVTITCDPGVHGINVVNRTCDPMDDFGHGTHVSGTIGAAGNNALGVVGVNWNVQLIGCKFLDANGGGQDSDAITCLDYVAALKSQGVNIVATNNSWGGGLYSQALTDAIQAQQKAGILFVAAAGNDFGDNDVNPTYPANTALPNVISVAATTDTDALATFSNIGKHTVHIGAPGQQILSTLPGNTYGTDSGTSMATPHVTGAAALLFGAESQPGLERYQKPTAGWKHAPIVVEPNDIWKPAECFWRNDLFGKDDSAAFATGKQCNCRCAWNRHCVRVSKHRLRSAQRECSSNRFAYWRSGHIT
jgi:serine protease